MSGVYDPLAASYLDEAEVRGELTRVFDHCKECRLCVSLCTTFPLLFDLIEQHPALDADRLTPFQQDQVIDRCYQCKLCHERCPYAPGEHEWAIDFPRLMIRANAMRHNAGQRSIRHSLTTQAISRTDLFGRLGTIARPIANNVVSAPARSIRRKALAAVTGVSAVRLLPPYAKQRFSTWFKKREPTISSPRQGRVVVFPTCLVEYHETRIGKDLVHVYERNGVECSISGATCCGAPWLHAGDTKHFAKVAKQNVKELAREIRAGSDVVVLQPTCGYVIKNDYVDFVGGSDAELVASHTYDAADYLVRLNGDPEREFDTLFDGPPAASVTYHAPCHLRAQNIGQSSVELLELTGAAVNVVAQCAGADGIWALRTENEELSIPIAQALFEAISSELGDEVVGDCHLANLAIQERSGVAPTHPISFLARRYGFRIDE
jgi:glycerol-3-phosphate dehydrogenase subunit C